MPLISLSVSSVGALRLALDHEKKSMPQALYWNVARSPVAPTARGVLDERAPSMQPSLVASRVVQDVAQRVASGSRAVGGEGRPNRRCRRRRRVVRAMPRTRCRTGFLGHELGRQVVVARADVVEAVVGRACSGPG